MPVPNVAKHFVERSVHTLQARKQGKLIRLILIALRFFVRTLCRSILLLGLQLIFVVFLSLLLLNTISTISSSPVALIFRSFF